MSKGLEVRGLFGDGLSGGSLVGGKGVVMVCCRLYSFDSVGSLLFQKSIEVKIKLFQ